VFPLVWHQSVLEGRVEQGGEDQGVGSVDVLYDGICESIQAWSGMRACFAQEGGDFKGKNCGGMGGLVAVGCWKPIGGD